MNGTVPKKQKGKCYLVLEEGCHGCGLFHLKQKAEPRLLKSQGRGVGGGRGTSSPTGAPPPLCACESQAHLATLQSLTWSMAVRLDSLHFSQLQVTGMLQRGPHSGKQGHFTDSVL